MALVSTQPLTEMSTRNLPGGKGQPALKADNLTTICEPRRLTALWASTACYRDSFSFYQSEEQMTNVKRWILVLLLWRVAIYAAGANKWSFREPEIAYQ
jgi:hypothetical protein